MAKSAKPYRSRKIGARALAPETLMMGYGHSPALSEGALKLPLFQTSTFVFRTAEEGKAFFELAYGASPPWKSPPQSLWTWYG